MIFSLGKTERSDFWWVAPLSIAVGFGTFIVYSTWAAFQGNHFEWGPYLSPFYSPKLTFEWWSFSPAFLILWAPGGFRMTCYYYRKAYYRAYFMDPPACAVGEFNEHNYSGETKFPFILQNLHRYFLYLALVFLVFLWHDVYKAFFFDSGFGVGVGTVVLLVNTTLLSFYTLSCHSLRHIVGGNIDCFSSCKLAGARQRTWSFVTLLNRRHMLWAWMSLFTVGFSDLYVRLVSMGVWNDLRLF